MFVFLVLVLMFMLTLFFDGVLQVSMLMLMFVLTLFSWGTASIYAYANVCVDIVFMEYCKCLLY